MSSSDESEDSIPEEDSAQLLPAIKPTMAISSDVTDVDLSDTPELCPKLSPKIVPPVRSSVYPSVPTYRLKEHIH